MPCAVFERHRAAVESSLLKAETRLGERTVRYWGEIDLENDAFDRRERFVEAFACRHPGRARGRLARPRRHPGDGPRSGRRGFRTASLPPAARCSEGRKPVADTGAFKREQRYFDE